MRVQFTPTSPSARPLRLPPQPSACPPEASLDSVTLSLSAEAPQPAPNWSRVALASAGLALAALGAAAPAQAAGFGPPGFQQDFQHHHGQNWDQRTAEEGSGWFIPRNPDSTPVRPHFAFQVPEGTSDLGPLRVLDNTRGQLRALRLQWPAERDPRARQAHESMFSDLLTKTDPSVRFEVIAESDGVRDLQALLDRLEVPQGRVRIHSLSLRSNSQELVQGLSMWSRDSSLTLTAADGHEILLLPHSFRDDGQVDAYLNRVIIQSSGAAPAFLHSRAPEIEVRRSSLDFEGGDIIANGRHVLISGATIADNAKRLNESQEQVVARFEAEMGRQVIVISPEPDFHLDLGISFLDDHTATVADPNLALTLLEGNHTGELDLMRRETAEKGLAEKYEAAAQRLTQAGYRVLRVPNLAGKSLSSPYLTYQNVLLENYGQTKRVYMPVYGIEATDSYARQLYEREGFEVIDISAALASTRLGGAIRCAVSELDVAQ